MKLLSAALLSLLLTGTQALASAGGAHSEGMGLLTIFFIAFGVLVVLFQFVPGITLFHGIMTALFSKEPSMPREHIVKSSRTGF